MNEDRTTREHLEPGYLINQRFEIVKHVGSGGFGDLYSCIDKKNEQICAVKIEYISSKKDSLVQEMRILFHLKDSIYFPFLIDDGVGPNFRFVCMDLFGPSLSSMRRHLPDKKFGLYTTLRLSLEMLRCIQELHLRRFLHRDIKPGNFLIRPNRRHPCVLIDYGLATTYWNPSTKQHIQSIEYVGFTGTYKYASFHAHEEIQLSRRDDLISWFYSVLEMASGSLPWPGVDDPDKTFKLKKYLPSTILCLSLPNEFVKIFIHIRKLRFSERPNYRKIKDLIMEAIYRNCKKEDMIYDWEKLSEDEISKFSNVSLKMEGPLETVESIRIDDNDVEGGCVACSVQ